MSKDTQVRSFPSNSPEYRAAFHTFLQHTDQKEKALGWLDAEVRGLAQSRVFVDAGAGTGKLTAYLAESFQEVVAIEPNPTLEADLRAICPSATVIPATILNVLPEAFSADFVLCSHVFYYIPGTDWDATLNRLLSWVAPAGVLAVGLQNSRTDCMSMIDHFLGHRLNLARLLPALEASSKGRYEARLNTVPARIVTPDLDTACVIAEFMLNLMPFEEAPTREALVAYVAKQFRRAGGEYSFSCDQDFLRIKRRI